MMGSMGSGPSPVANEAMNLVTALADPVAFKQRIAEHDARIQAANAAEATAAEKIAEAKRIEGEVGGRELAVSKREVAVGLVETTQTGMHESLARREAAVSAREVAVGQDAANKEAALKAREEAVASRELAAQNAADKAAETQQAADALKADYEGRLAKLRALTA